MHFSIEYVLSDSPAGCVLEFSILLPAILFIIINVRSNVILNVIAKCIKKAHFEMYSFRLLLLPSPFLNFDLYRKNANKPVKRKTASIEHIMYA